MSSPLPERSARGIRQSDWIKTGRDGQPSARPIVFFRGRKDVGRTEDGMVELSVDHLDHDGVLPAMLRKRNVAIHGAVEFSAKLDLAAVPATWHSMVGFERREEDGNPHHGHLLIHEDAPDELELYVAAQLLLHHVVHRLTGP